MQASSSVPTFSPNVSMTETPTSRDGFASLSHAELVTLAVANQKELSSGRVQMADLKAKYSETLNKTDTFFKQTFQGLKPEMNREAVMEIRKNGVAFNGELFDKLEAVKKEQQDAGKIQIGEFEERKERFVETLQGFKEQIAEFKYPKKEKHREAVKAFRNDFESYRSESKSLMECAKRVKDHAVIKSEEKSKEDELLKFMHELPIQIMTVDTRLIALETRAEVLSKMKKFEGDILKSQKSLTKVMDSEEPDFKSLEKDGVIASFDEAKRRMVSFEEAIQPSMKGLNELLGQLSSKHDVSQHLNTVVLNSKTLEKECRYKISADLSALRKEIRTYIAELNGAMNSLKNVVISNKDTINAYLSGIERESFATSMLPSFFGGTVTKEFVTL